MCGFSSRFAMAAFVLVAGCGDDGEGDDIADDDDGVVVEAGFNDCPSIGSATVSPVTTLVGSTIALTTTVTDVDGDPLEVAWTASAGSFADPAAPSTTYLCTVVGAQMLTLTVSDGRGCSDSYVTTVTCGEN